MEERQKFLTTILVVGIVGVLFLGGMGYQMFTLGVSFIKGENSLSSRIEAQQAELARLEKIRDKELPAAEEELVRLESNSDLAQQLVPAEVQPEQLIKYIRTKADESRVTLVRIVPERKSANTRGAKDPWEEINYQMELKGSYDSIALFINYMEMFEASNESGGLEHRLFAVKNLSIEAEEKGLTEETPHKVSLDMVTYRYQPVQTKAIGRKR